MSSVSRLHGCRDNLYLEKTTIMEGFYSLWNTLNNSPIVLLILGFALTTIFGGLLTNRWQNRAKEWELKTSLVARMTEEVMNILMATQLAEVGAKSQSQSDFDAAYKRWEIQQGVISSTIRAYFREEKLGKAWDEFAEHVSSFYALTGTNVLDYRLRTLNKLKAYVGLETPDSDNLLNLEWRRSDNDELRGKYGRSWSNLKLAIIRKNSDMQRAIIKSRTVVSS